MDGGGQVINYELLNLKLFLRKDLFNQNKDSIDLVYLRDTNRDVYTLYKLLFTLHEDSQQDITLEYFILSFYNTYPYAEKNDYDALFTRMAEFKISEEEIESLIKKAKQKELLVKISSLAFEASQGRKDIQEVVDTLKTVSFSPESYGVIDLPEASSSFEEAVAGVATKEGYRWRLNSLNKSLGSLRKGDFGFIFARPEVGKTTFLSSEVSNFLLQGLDESRKIVWLNNEESGWKVMLRLLSSCFGVPSSKILSNYKFYIEKFREKTHNRFLMYDSANITKAHVEKIVKVHTPDIVLYDQIDKIKGFSSDREDLKLGAIYQWARELAKDAHVSIGVSQANGHGEGVKYLTMDHVANAATSKQAEGDFIIGIGKSNDVEDQESRYLNILKNKLLGDKDSKEELRHGRFEVLIRPVIGRYEDTATHAT